MEVHFAVCRIAQVSNDVGIGVVVTNEPPSAAVSEDKLRPSGEEMLMVVVVVVGADVLGGHDAESMKRRDKEEAVVEVFGVVQSDYVYHLLS